MFQGNKTAEDPEQGEQDWDYTIENNAENCFVYFWLHNSIMHQISLGY